MSNNDRHETLGALFVAGLLVALVLAMAVICRGAEPRVPRLADAIDESRSPNAVAVGRKLFFSPIISSNGKVACSSCHDPAKGWTDGKIVSDGVNGKTTRNAPTIPGAKYSAELFYDFRARDLSGQSLAVLVNNIEVGHTTTDPVLRRLQADEGFREAFAKAFPTAEQPITEATVTSVLAAFQRSLKASGSPLERFLDGDDKALTAAQKAGYAVFKKGGCVNCHQPEQHLRTLVDDPATRKDERCANVGTAVRFPLSTGQIDQGRSNQTGRGEDARAFAIPSLYDLRRTGPYGVFGKSESIRDRVLHYTKLPRDAADARLNRDWKPTDDEVESLVRFLDTATYSRSYPK